jgi:hypothetical protein
MSEQKQSQPAAPSTTAPSTTPATAPASSYRVPADATLQHAAKLAIVEDKPIMLDYWTSSLDKKSLIGVRENGEKLLVKSAEEYTSTIVKFYKSGTDFIVITENSIYLVGSEIPSRKIT